MDKTLALFLGVAFLSAGVGFIAGIFWEKLTQITKKSKEIHDNLKKFGKD